VLFWYDFSKRKATTLAEQFHKMAEVEINNRIGCSQKERKTQAKINCQCPTEFKHYIDPLALTCHLQRE
jgi:hypothetical protein